MNRRSAIQVAALIERVGRLFATDAHAEGLFPVQWETLRYLNRANRFSRSHTALTAYLGLTKGTVSTTLSSMEDRGLICREQDDQDRRSKRLTLTPAGKKALRKDPINAWAGQINAMEDAEKDALERGLAALIESRLARQNRSAFGMCEACIHFRQKHEAGNPHFCGLLQLPLSKRDASLICAEQIPRS